MKSSPFGNEEATKMFRELLRGEIKNIQSLGNDFVLGASQ
jgi:hypothetical protein